MSIESEAQKDLALSDEDAEGIAGGKKTKKAKTHTAGTTHTVPYIKVPGYTGTPDSSLPESDCDPDEMTATSDGTTAT